VTRAEYLEFVEEVMYFADTLPDQAVVNSDSFGDSLLRDTPEVCAALRQAHQDYCNRVAGILGLERE
jgi:hypothetical protein